MELNSKEKWEAQFGKIEAGESIPDGYSLSEKAFEDFERNPVWQAISTQLMNALKLLRDNLETLGANDKIPVEAVPYTMSFYQGQAYQLRLLLDLPSVLRMEASYERAKEEKETK